MSTIIKTKLTGAILLLIAILIATNPLTVRGQFAGQFVHPGGLHTQADFNRMAAKVAANASPWVDSYNQLTPIWMANLGMPWDPQTQIVRGAAPNNYARSQDDALAIYYHALRWRITGNTNYAEEAIVGMNDWSGTMTNGVGGNSNYALGAGICGYEFAVAGEAMRGYTNWSPASINAYSNFLMVFYGSCNYYLSGHNGTCDSHYWANWDACNVAAIMAIGVFCDNTNIFNQAVNYIETGNGNGNMTSAAWYVHTNGLAQWEESGRDQAHTMDGIAWLGVACQIAWNQGVDLYGFDNNRFLRGLEYSAKYNLFNNVPYVAFYVCDPADDFGTGALSSGSQGFLPPTWDLFYNHYVNIKGLAAPYTAQAAALLRPDGFYNNANSPDFLGFTTLTCLLDPIPAGAVPSGVITSVSGTNVILTWQGSAYATNYNILRATVSGGPYTTIATVSSSSDRVYMDNTVTNGGTYYYVVNEQDQFGVSPNSPEKAVSILNQLVAYYKFNESSGTTTADSSGLSPSATLMNGATFAAGKYGNAVSLNGSSQYVALPNGLLNNLGDFTIATWVYLNSVTTWMRIFDFGADTDRYMFLTPSAGSTVRFSITKFSGDGEQQINGTSPMSTGWHHVAVTLKGTEGTGVGVLYVDGLPVGTNSAMFYTPGMIGELVNDTNNFIGRSQFSGDPYLNGLVDDFRIYNGALTTAQIAALYASAPPAAPAAPIPVSATAASASVINLSWPASSGATNYLVQRSLNNGGPYAVVASGVTATNYTDTGLSGNTAYYYVIAAVNNGGQGADSIQASATTLTPPAVPSSLTATGMYGGQIVLSWSASAGATSYNVNRSLITGGPYVTIATNVMTTGFTNSGLVFNATYYYVVSAVNANGASPNSNETNSIVPVPSLVWNGNVNTNWDVNLTTNWLFGGAPSTYFVDGAAVTFNDTANGSTVNLSAAVSPYSMVFSNSALNYTVGSANGSGIGGAATLTKVGTGTVTLTATNTFTGGITINTGGTLAIGGGGVLGGGNYSGNISCYGTFSYNSSAAQTLSGNISLSGSVSKTGAGTLSLTKANDYTGPTTLNSGVLALTGNGGILSSSAILIGKTSGSSAAIFQAGANTVVNPAAVLGALQIGSTPGGYGYYNVSSGTINLAGEMDIGGSSGGAGTFGQFDMSGGNVVMPNSTSTYFLPDRGAAGESSVVNLSGGTVGISLNATPTFAGANGFAANWNGSGAAQTNTTTISGTGQFITPSLNANLNVGGNSANVVNLNLNGGLMQVLGIPSAAGTAQINFNGGTLEAGTNGGLFLGGLTGANIYGGGATINDNGQSIAVDQPLQAPAGNGVITIPVATGGAGYVMPPQVTITGSGGSNATAYAAIAGGAVTGIVVTCPGAGYTSAPTVKLSGGGFTTAATLGTPTIAANISGGLTKLGAGTLTLGGSNNYTGPTVIDAGTLRLGGPLLYFTFNDTNGTTVINQGSGGAALNGVLTGTNVNIVPGGLSGNALLVSNGPANTGYVLVNNPVVAMTGAHSWTIAMWVKTTTAGGVYAYQGSGSWASGNMTFYLNEGSDAGYGTKAGGVSFAQGWEEGTTTINDNNWHFLAMTCNGATKAMYVDGNVDSIVSSWAASTGVGSQLWIGGSADTGDKDIGLSGMIDNVSVYDRALSQNEITNLMNGIKAATPCLPATANVTVGSGATLVLDSVAQTLGSLTGSNSSSVLLGGSTATAFTFGNTSNTVFAGSISGNGSVTKNGAGAVTLSGANTYSGATVINSGTVKFGQSNNTNYVASLGPVLWFNFDQGVDVVDGIVTNLGSGGMAMNGILNGDTTNGTNGAAIVSSGRYGNALSLDGDSDVTINSEVTPLDCDATGASWTYALWLKTGTAGAVYGYQGDGTWNYDATTFYLNSNGTSAGTKAGGVRYGDGWLTGTTTLNNNNWHFVAVTVSGGVKTLFVDGNVEVQTGTTGWAAPAMTWANQFWIGQSPDAGDGEASFSGLIDSVYMFNRALSQVEITNLMANQSVDVLASVTGQLPVTSPVSLAAATLDLSGTTQTIASLSDTNGGGGVVTNSAGAAATLIFNTATTNTFSGQIRDASSAAISLIKTGAGMQSLNGANNYNGNTAVNGGTLAFGQAALPTNATVTVAGSAVLNLNFVGTNRVGGIVLNGTSQMPGVYNAASSTPYLAGAGSLLIANPVATGVTNISYTISGDGLTLSWPPDHTGWRLQAQTNAINSGLGTNWMDVVGGASTNQVTIPMNLTNGSVFFRLVYP